MCDVTPVTDDGMKVENRVVFWSTRNPQNNYGLKHQKYTTVWKYWKTFWFLKAEPE